MTEAEIIRSIEQRLQEMISTIGGLWTEFDSLKRLVYRQSSVNGGIVSAKYVHTDNTKLGCDLATLDEDFLDIASIGKANEHMTESLTGREIQVLNHVADGNTNKQIAHILGISEQTVKCHVSSILSKLRANDRAHAVARAMEDGLLSVERKEERMIAVS